MNQSNDGMVCAAHPLAVQAGWEILNAGGNAFDTAVAVAAVLNVVEPMMSGIGGYGTILTYEAAENNIQFLNASGRIPKNVDSNAFRAPTPHYEANRRSAKAISTPVNLQSWSELSKKGVLDWSRLLQPAIQLASEGFPTDARLAFFIAQQFEHFGEEAQSIYGKNDGPITEGVLLKQSAFANSLALIASDGVQAFYEGSIGQKICKMVEEMGGFLAQDDLETAVAEWYEPIQIDYRGHQVFTAAPPATSFPGLIRLGLLRQFDVAGWEHNGPEHLHHFAEITKHAFWCRLNYAGDPDIQSPPLDHLLSDDYLGKIARDISSSKASVFTPPTEFGESSQHTTHFVVADKQGNLVSSTQTVGQAFGSRLMAPGTGIWLNNSLQYCTFEPAGNPMDAHAGRHKLSGDMPTIIARNGRPWAALGTPGGHTIGQTVPQLVSNLIDFGLDMQVAIDAPRVSFVEPNSLHVEKAIADSTAEKLSQIGHVVIRPEGGIGFAHGLTVHQDDDEETAVFEGGFDNRGAALVG